MTVQMGPLTLVCEMNMGFLEGLKQSLAVRMWNVTCSGQEKIAGGSLWSQPCLLDHATCHRASTQLVRHTVNGQTLTDLSSSKCYYLD